MASRQHELSVTFRKERRVFWNDSGETRVVIADADEETPSGEVNEITLRGEAAEGDLVSGLQYRFWGAWVTHHKHGRQFLFTTFLEESPATQSAILTYLQQCRGIGYMTAKKIYTAFGDKAVNRLADSPDEVAAAVKLKPETAAAAAEFLQSNAMTRRAKMDLLGLLHGRGLPKRVLEWGLRDYGCRAAEIFAKRPYLLMRYPGVGFLKADAIYTELGKNPRSTKRQSLCAWNAVKHGENGSTWHPFAIARDAIREKVSGAKVDVDNAVSWAIRAKGLEERFANGIRWLAEKQKADDETRIAEFVAWADQEQRFEWPDVSTIGDISDHQRETLRSCLTGNIVMLHGSAGTGKTFAAGAVIRRVAEEIGLDLIAACGPTGKSAVRLTESMTRCGIDLRATTIHTLLEVEPSSGSWRFRRSERNPLNQRLIVADEDSMNDVPLMRALLSARGRGCAILFLGDPEAQLPPVGHGNPALDFMRAGVPCGTLTEIRRNSGRIVKVCAEIRDNRRYLPSQKLDLENGENQLHIEKADPEDQIEMLSALIMKFKASPEQKYDPVWDIQVLVPVNKKSPISRKVINQRLQELLNPGGKTEGGSPFRVGDKVINQKNGQLPNALFKKDDDPFSDGPTAPQPEKHYVANGEQGEVLEVFASRTIIQLRSPDRIVIVPRSSKSSDEISDSDEEESGTGCSWDLGYAGTPHTAQGSEWPIVITMLDEYPGARRVMTRQWLYTAVSRGKVIGFTIGKMTVANEACRRDGLQRKTFLAEKITELRNQMVAANDVKDTAACECEGVGCEECFGGNAPTATQWSVAFCEKLLAGVI